MDLNLLDLVFKLFTFSALFHSVDVFSVGNDKDKEYY